MRNHSPSISFPQWWKVEGTSPNRPNGLADRSGEAVKRKYYDWGATSTTLHTSPSFIARPMGDFKCNATLWGLSKHSLHHSITFSPPMILAIVGGNSWLSGLELGFRVEQEVDGTELRDFPWMLDKPPYVRFALKGLAITRLHTWPRGATVTTPTDFVPEPSPDYVPESDPEADPKEDDDEDPEEDPVDYHVDGGDDDDDEEGSSEDDEDDDMEIRPADQGLIAEDDRCRSRQMCLRPHTTTPCIQCDSIGFSFRALVPTQYGPMQCLQTSRISTPPSSLSPGHHLDITLCGTVEVDRPMVTLPPRRDTIMSDSDESGVTHTEISSLFEDLSYIGSPGVVALGPRLPDYITWPRGATVTTLPDFCPRRGPPRYFPSIMHSSSEVFLAEGAATACCCLTNCSVKDYVPKEGSSEDDEDDDMDIEADDEEEHLALADSAVVSLPAADQASSAEETEPFETDESTAKPPPHLAYRVTARISILAPVPTPVWSDAEVARLLAISTPPSSPLSPWSSPLPQIPSPPLPPIPSPSLPVSSPVPVLSPSPPASPIRPLGYRAAMIRLRAEAASTSHSLPLPPPIILSHTRPAAPSSGTPPLHLLSTDRREDRPEVTLPPRKRLGIALGPAYEVRESSSAAAARPAGGLRADYGFVATMDREIRRDPERDVGYGITDS
ncbi:hypothetical protein Tco_0360926 [Tanacetum coccineum]